jgi:hypothetical protein
MDYLAQDHPTGKIQLKGDPLTENLLTAISFDSATKKNFEKTMNPFLSNLHPEKTFKRP